MIRTTFTLLASMLALTPVVNSQGNDSTIIDHTTTKSNIKGSPRNEKKDINYLINLLFKTGEEDNIKEHLAPVLGLPGPMPAKGRTISEAHNGKDLIEHECILAYQTPSDGETSSNSSPFCLFLHKHQISGHDDESLYFRINLDGRLEKAVMIRGKRDDDGKIVHGASTSFDQDIESSKTKKDFATEIDGLKKWLNAQRKLPVKNSGFTSDPNSH